MKKRHYPYIATILLLIAVGLIFIHERKENGNSVVNEQEVTTSKEQSGINTGEVIIQNPTDANSITNEKNNQKDITAPSKEDIFYEDKVKDIIKGEAEQNGQGSLTFPYTIPDTDLTILNLASYDGRFLEDGSDQFREGLAVLAVKNDGKTPIEYADIRVKSGGKEFVFVATVLNPDDIILIQEKNAALYRSTEITECSAQLAYTDDFEDSASQITVKEREDGGLEIQNIGDELIPCVRVFYKYYLPEDNAYVGGITYNVKVNDLKPGESQTVHSSHFMYGKSRVVMVRTYDDNQ